MCRKQTRGCIGKTRGAMRFSLLFSPFSSPNGAIFIELYSWLSLVVPSPISISNWETPQQPTLAPLSPSNLPHRHCYTSPCLPKAHPRHWLPLEASRQGLSHTNTLYSPLIPGQNPSTATPSPSNEAIPDHIERSCQWLTTSFRDPDYSFFSLCYLFSILMLDMHLDLVPYVWVWVVLVL